MDYNFSDIENALSKLEKSVANETTDEALKAGAGIILEAQKSLVPKRERLLMNSLQVGKVIGTGANKKILVGIDPSKYEQCRYGFYQEYGTATMVGKKWMKGAFISSAKSANNEIAKILQKILWK